MSQTPGNSHHMVSGRSRLAPEDAICSASASGASRGRNTPALEAATSRPVGGSRPHSNRRRRRDRERSRHVTWKKLLWVKQSYPDNYTDEETFLDHLQLNPRLKPYEFWPLMAGSMVIVQHICSVCIFVCCFSGIIHERVSPITVVSLASLGTFLGWVLWDSWVGREAAAMEDSLIEKEQSTANTRLSGDCAMDDALDDKVRGLGLVPLNLSVIPSALEPSSRVTGSMTSALNTGHPTGASTFANYRNYPLYGEHGIVLSPGIQQRLATVKSAILIYCALLGLSPILKSLTKSTTSDSIWAMSCWLMCINVFFFDYGGGEDAKFPASLSTNAAVMASTVLASRLSDTTHVFSLLLFSIEVFGLFPVFRRHLRRISWQGHLALTIFLVVGASGGVGWTISRGGWKAATAGIILGSSLTFLAMGMCSWWLISLQKYKNEIHGPWDPARPVIRRRWD